MIASMQLAPLIVPTSLFPDMPRHNYHIIKPFVEEYCRQFGLDYVEKPLQTAFADIFRFIAKLYCLSDTRHSDHWEHRGPCGPRPTGIRDNISRWSLQSQHSLFNFSFLDYGFPTSRCYLNTVVTFVLLEYIFNNLDLWIFEMISWPQLNFTSKLTYISSLW